MDCGPEFSAAPPPKTQIVALDVQLSYPKKRPEPLDFSWVAKKIRIVSQNSEMLFKNTLFFLKMQKMPVFGEKHQFFKNFNLFPEIDKKSIFWFFFEKLPMELLGQIPS